MKLQRMGTLLLAYMALPPVVAGAAGIPVVNEGMAAGPAAFQSFFLSPDDSDGNLSIDVLGMDAGGNPGEFLQILHFHDPVEEPEGNPDGYSIQSIHDYQLFSWDPLVDGEVVSVSFSIDIESSVPLGVGFSVAQGNGGSLAGFQFIGSTDGWQKISSGPLSTAEFGGIDFAGGEPLRFGFSVITSSDGFGEVAFFGEQFAANLDNFQVSVAVVPVPAAAWLLLSSLGVLGLVARRQRLHP